MSSGFPTDARLRTLPQLLNWKGLRTGRRQSWEGEGSTPDTVPEFPERVPWFLYQREDTLPAGIEYPYGGVVLL